MLVSFSSITLVRGERNHGCVLSKLTYCQMFICISGRKCAFLVQMRKISKPISPLSHRQKTLAEDWCAGEGPLLI